MHFMMTGDRQIARREDYLLQLAEMSHEMLDLSPRGVDAAAAAAAATGAATH